MAPTPQPPRRHRHDEPHSVAVQHAPLSRGHGRNKCASATSGGCTGCGTKGCFARVLATQLLNRAAHRARRSSGDGAPRDRQNRLVEDLVQAGQQNCGALQHGVATYTSGCMVFTRSLRRVVWPQKFRPALPKGYDGSSNPSSSCSSTPPPSKLRGETTRSWPTGSPTRYATLRCCGS